MPPKMSAPAQQPSPERAPVLFNCTRRPQYVIAGTRVIKLPTAPSPTIIEVYGQRGELKVIVDPHANIEAELDISSGEAAATIDMPPPMPGALFLVEDDILLRSPGRSDLATPAFYKIVSIMDLDLSLVPELKARVDSKLGKTAPVDEDDIDFTDDGSLWIDWVDRSAPDVRLSALAGVSLHLSSLPPGSPNQMLS